MEISENLTVSDVFRGQRMGALGTDGLKPIGQWLQTYALNFENWCKQ